MLENKQQVIFRKITVHASNVRKPWFYKERNTVKYWDTQYKKTFWADFIMKFNKKYIRTII